LIWFNLSCLFFCPDIVFRKLWSMIWNCSIRTLTLNVLICPLNVITVRCCKSGPKDGTTKQSLSNIDTEYFFIHKILSRTISVFAFDKWSKSYGYRLWKNAVKKWTRINKVMERTKDDATKKKQHIYFFRLMWIFRTFWFFLTITCSIIYHSRRQISYWVSSLVRHTWPEYILWDIYVALYSH
jgi:hypothetical protein